MECNVQWYICNLRETLSLLGLGRLRIDKFYWMGNSMAFWFFSHCSSAAAEHLNFQKAPRFLLSKGKRVLDQADG